MNKEALLSNIDKLHTTNLGLKRIKNNLNLSQKDIISYCQDQIKNKDCHIVAKGKNWYCTNNNVRITININTYTIITAHIIKAA